jgi:tetratricopeptide (TPR) repeat protein
LVAQGLDGEHQTTAHSRALAAALTALKEAEDFLPASAPLEANVDLPATIAGHRTPVLQGTRDQRLTPPLAMQSYLTFAQEQLAIAAGREVAGSMALCCLGKLHAALARQQTDLLRAPGPKAVTFYQAALLVDPRNHLASHELGVLLAQAGRYEAARAVLEHAVAILPQWESWHSLAKVYRLLGQGPQARWADEQAMAVQQAARGQPNALATTPAAQVRWVAPNVLAKVPAPPSDGRKQ